MLSSRFRIPRTLHHHFCATPIYATRWCSSTSSSLQKENEDLKQALKTANEALIVMLQKENESLKLSSSALQLQNESLNEELTTMKTSATSLQQTIENLKHAIQHANQVQLKVKHEATELKLQIANMEARSSAEKIASLFGVSNLTPKMILQSLSMAQCPKMIAHLCETIHNDVMLFRHHSAFVNDATAPALLAALPHATTDESCEMIFRTASAINLGFDPPLLGIFSTPEAVTIFCDAACKNAKTNEAVQNVMRALDCIAADLYLNKAKADSTYSHCENTFNALIPRVTTYETAKLLMCRLLDLLRYNESMWDERFGSAYSPLEVKLLPLSKIKNVSQTAEFENIMNKIKNCRARDDF